MPSSHAPVALVSGASRGLGAAIADALGGVGHPVAVNYSRSQQQADDVVAAIQAAGGRAAAFGADVTDERGVQKLVDEVTAQLGPIGVLVVNATGPQDSVPAAELEWVRDVVPMLDFFLRSPLLLTQAVLPAMIERRWGRIVHIGSDVVQRVPEGNAAYVAAKSAQLGFARSSAQELGVHGITVNTVSPGWIPVERHQGTDVDQLDTYASTVPLGRLGEPREIASAVVWLSSEGASYVNGTNVVVNGGKTSS